MWMRQSGPAEKRWRLRRSITLSALLRCLTSAFGCGAGLLALGTRRIWMRRSRSSVRRLLLWASAVCDPCQAVTPLVLVGSPAGGTGVGDYIATTEPNKVVWTKLLADMYADAGEVQSNTVSASVKGIRCDHMYPQEWRKPGCVFPAFVPTVDMSGLPAIAESIRKVQGRGIHIGKPGSRHPLHRNSGPQERDNNRRLVCPKGLKRPPNTQCDEYPFASTSEGGTKLPPIDRTREWVPRHENQKQGVILSGFYRNNRILRGSPGDTFYVQA
jgi:hypothetical protein